MMMMKKVWVAFLFTVLAAFGFADDLMYRDAFNSTYTNVMGVWTNNSGVYSTTKTVTGSGWINIQYNYGSGSRSEDNGKSFSGAGTYNLSYNTSTKVFTVTALRNVTSLTVTGVTTLYAGGALQLGKTVYWSDSTTSTNDTVAWTSSNTAVATINASSGLVTAVAAGTTTISVAKDGKTGTATVTVTPVLASTITLGGQDSTYVGGTLQTTYSVTFNSGLLSSTTPLSWTSSDPTVATVSSTGLVTTVALGTAIITGTKDGVSASKTITVTGVVATSVTISGNGTVMIDGSIQLGKSITYNNGVVSTTDPVVWASLDTGIAVIDQNGYITPIGAGSTTITATKNDAVGSKSITVAAPATIAISGNASVKIGSLLQLGYTVTYTDATTSATTPVVWESSNPLVATVSATGQVTPVAAGIADIVCTKGTVSGSKTVTVVDVASIAISGVTTVIAGSSVQLGYIITYTDGTTSSTDAATWSSTDESVVIAVVNSVGTVTGIAPGIATVNVTKNGVTGTQSVTVNPVIVDTVTVSGSSSVLVGSTLQLGYTVTYNNTTTSTTTPVTWASSDATVATVSASGLVTPVAAGTVTITVTKDGVTNSKLITVVAKYATAVALAGSATATVGGTVQLTYTITYNTGSPSTTDGLTWTSSDTAKATVSSTGLVTPLSIGTVTITGTHDAVSATKTITITNADPWYYRGTTNGWGVTEMAMTAANTYSITIDYTNDTGTAGTSTGPRFKISHYNDWTAAYPSSDYLIPTKAMYSIVFNSSTHAITITQVVGAVTATAVSISGNASAVAGSTIQLGYTVTYNNSTTSTTTPVAWTTSNAAKATVSSTGLVTAVAAGTATITCIKDAISSTKVITVTAPVTVASVAVTGNSTAVAGSTAQLGYLVTYSDATTSTTTPVTWASSDATIATVNSSGLVTGVAAGSATISCTKDATVGTKLMTINAVTVSSIAVSGTLTVTAGSPTQLSNVVTFNNGVTSTSQAVTWTSANTAIATVNASSGLVTGVAAGTVTITCSAGGVNGTASVTVNPLVTDAWYFSGTPNGWTATSMTFIGNNKWQIVANFTNDAGTAGTATGPRFKIRHSATAWTEAYPSSDCLIPVKANYVITFDSYLKSVLTIVQVGQSITAFNGTMYQAFSWDLNTNGDRRVYDLWTELQNQASYLSGLGISAIWVPSPAKGAMEGGYPNGNYIQGGGNFNGYAVYDRYDLGEFNQGGSLQNGGNVRTKWGTKQQFIDTVTTLHSVGISVLAETIMNHNIGGDGDEVVYAEQVYPNNRGVGTGTWGNILVDSKYDYNARNNAYSTFKFSAAAGHFRGYDRNKYNPTDDTKIYRFQGKSWSYAVDGGGAANDVGYQGDWCGNTEYLLGMDIDHSNTAVQQYFKDWGEWLVNTTNVDGFRLDAIKHYNWTFQKDWIAYLRAKFPAKNLFAVGEYWEDIGTYNTSLYLAKTNYTINVFDFPLARKFIQHANYGADLRYTFDNTITSVNPIKSVTFVDNHDIEKFRNPTTGMTDWFKPQAYAMILLREAGYPCVYYGDFNGTDGIPSKKTAIEKLLNVRHFYAYGQQDNYNTNADYIGWVRKGDAQHPNAIAVVLSDNGAAPGSIYMYTGKANTTFTDEMGNYGGSIITDANGYATFKCSGGSVSVWVSR